MNRIPSPSRRLLGALVAVPFVIAACTTTASETTEPEAAESIPAAEEAVASPQPELTTEAPEEEPEAAAWLDIELTDAATGETFTLASLAGEVVAIEPMAIWCSNCKAQQDNVKAAYEDIAGAGVTYISLGIDPGEDPDCAGQVRRAQRLRVDVRAVTRGALPGAKRPLRPADPVGAVHAPRGARCVTVRSSPRSGASTAPSGCSRSSTRRPPPDRP